MKDFDLSTDGDLKLVESELQECDDMKLLVQKALCTIASVSHDWFYDNIGSDLEQIIGKRLNQEIMSEGETLIRNSVCKKGYINESDLHIESKQISNEYLGYNVYISDKYKEYKYHLIEVSIDMVRGIIVKYGGDVDANFK